MQEPVISVGIVHAETIKFALFGDFLPAGSNNVLKGKYSASIKDNKIVLNGSGTSVTFGEQVMLTPSREDEEYFVLENVIIGVHFHWERAEKQSFRGSLQLYISEGKIYAINHIKIEEYLISVVSSEMSARSHIEMLKAHAIVSRGWLMAQIEKSKKLKKTLQSPERMIRTDDKLIRFWDREDHEFFDVCADDHCQRYQGITRIFTNVAKRAVEETRGLVLMHGDEYCDARFSKACGGISEAFENVWENTHFDYLEAIVDYKFEPGDFDIDFTKEQNAVKWIKGNPPAFCNTNDKRILSQVLNNYDQETIDFYRWKVEYTQEELQKLIQKKTGIDFGEILDLVPLKRGKSARIYEMKIVGTKKEFIIGKELEIRRALSESHLYSSAFIVEKQEMAGNVPQRFKLTGAGWGHGVGMCQIGAAVMAEKNYLFDEILAHYYKHSALKRAY